MVALKDMRRHQLVVGPAKQDGQGKGRAGSGWGGWARGLKVEGGSLAREWRKQGFIKAVRQTHRSVYVAGPSDNKGRTEKQPRAC